MKKSHYFILGGVLALIGIIFFTVWMFSSPIVPAQLIEVTGSVEVDDGSGYKAVTGDIELKQDHKIKTNEGEATVVLQESVVVTLEPNTEVVVSELSKSSVKLNQPTGQTWTKFAKITGVSQVEIATPDTVATVRGTFFGLNRNRALLGNGRLNVGYKGQTITLNGMQKSSFAGGSLSTQAVTAKERALLESRRQAMINHLKRVRALEVAKHQFALSMIQKRYGWDYNQLLAKLAELDDNTADLQALEKQAPIRLSATKKVIALTEEIRKLKKVQLPQATGTPTGGQGSALTAECPGGENCCCQHGFPDCSEGFECRQWNVPGKQYFGTCVKKGTNPGAPLQLHSSQPPFCGK